MSRPDPYLHFVVRKDLTTRQRACQLIHAMDDWAAEHGAHGGPILVFGVRDEAQLLEHATSDAVVFREPHYEARRPPWRAALAPPGLRLA